LTNIHHNQTEREVTIIGAGATGLSAAIFLQKHGYQPRILEKRERAKITKAIGINPVTLQLFENTEITQRLIKNGWRLDCMNFWYNDELIYKNEFSKVKHKYPYMIVQPQYETEQILEEYLTEKGIDVERNVELLKLTNEGATLKLDFKNLDNNTLFAIQTKGAVLGADGSKSKVRQDLGVEMLGWEHPTVHTFYDVELDTPITDKEGHYRIYKDGAMIMLHIRDGIWRVGGNLKQPLNYLPKGTKIGKISWEVNVTINEKVAQNFSVGNVHILGDAAHLHSPLGGKGMNMCIEDGYVFAKLFSQNNEGEFSKIRRKKAQNMVGILGQLSETIGGQHTLGRVIRSGMKPFSFMFPVIMPYMRKFLLGLK
jgi:2-polyprenyl-6-methoxyphenol hydroxylase-like FAD-dependent oxidoreductase